MEPLVGVEVNVLTGSKLIKCNDASKERMLVILWRNVIWLSLCLTNE